jgi:thiamine biosynthesis lipoprotein
MSNKLTQWIFDAIGTKWIIDIYQPIPNDKDLLNKIQERIEVYDKTYSRFRMDSLVTQMAHTNKTYTLPPDAEKLFSLYKKIYFLTKGLVTPLVGQLLVDAGYDQKYSLEEKKRLTSPLSWEETLDYSFPYLTLKKPALLDFGAAGKGYLIDIISNLLGDNGISHFCIDAGGDILCKGEKELRIGLENPQNTQEVLGVLTLQNQSVCGSAGNRRKWGKYHHIFNPKTQTSVETILATWVCAKTAMEADALATCLFFVSPTELVADFTFDYFILRPDFTFEKSTNFNAEVFIN